jgi:hypothetical protein
MLAIIPTDTSSNNIKQICKPQKPFDLENELKESTLQVAEL